FTIDETKTPIFCSVNTSTDAVKYEWSINNGGTFIGSSSTDENPCYQWPDTGCFRVTLKAINSIGCWDTTSQVVCSSFVAIIIPYNVFTPEPKDNFNDVFRVKAQGLDKFDIKIYNRWGELVFESEDYNFAWDGTVKNKGKIECPEGTYLYIMNYQIKNKPLNDGRDKPMSGVVTLIRGKKD
ncbi:MAG: gliding motility-associated C-terminal domain-containing protein, partial [Bacteroidia bacterium]